MVGIKRRVWVAPLAIGIILLFFYMPILSLMVFSFNDSRSLTAWSGFSLQWYEALFRNREVMMAISTTVSIALISTLVSTVLGTLAAIGVSKSRRIIKELVLNVNNFPILNPEIVTAIGLMLLYSTLNIQKGFMTMLLAHIIFSTPYVILSVLPRLRRLDPDIAEAALDLGATPLQALVKVIVPMILPGVISGALIAFTMSFDDFVISYFVTGNGVKNISILVYTMSKRINPTINALSTIMVVIITVVLVVVNLYPIFTKKEVREIE
jgi:spermidine/putrescine transport system permease protein